MSQVSESLIEAMRRSSRRGEYALPDALRSEVAGWFGALGHVTAATLYPGESELFPFKRGGGDVCTWTRERDRLHHTTHGVLAYLSDPNDVGEILKHVESPSSVFGAFVFRGVESLGAICTAGFTRIRAGAVGDHSNLSVYVGRERVLWSGAGKRASSMGVPLVLCTSTSMVDPERWDRVTLHNPRYGV